MKTNQIFAELMKRYFQDEDVSKYETQELIDELAILWSVLANKITVIKINNKNYQLQMSFLELSRGLGQYFFKLTNKYVVPEFFVLSYDCTLRYEEEEGVKACVDHLYDKCDVTGIYEVECPPFNPRYGIYPYVWVDFVTGECLYYTRRVRKGKLASVINHVTIEEYDKYVEKIVNIAKQKIASKNGNKNKKKKKAKTSKQAAK